MATATERISAGAVSVGVGVALVGLQLRYPEDRVVGDVLIIAGLALVFLPMLWLIAARLRRSSAELRVGYPSGSVPPSATPRITEGVVERVGGDPGYPPKRLSERMARDEAAEVAPYRTGEVNLRHTYECPLCGLVEVGLERFRRHRALPHRRLRYGDGQGSGTLTFGDGARRRTVRWGDDFWALQQTARDLLDADPDVRLLGQVEPANDAARRVERALEARLADEEREQPRLRYRDAPGAGTLTFRDASGAMQTVAPGQEFTTDVATAATLLRTDPNVHAVEPLPAGRLVLALWEEGDQVRTAVARSKRVSLGPSGDPMPPLDAEQTAAHARYRDWLDRCERLVTAKWSRYLPAFRTALEAPHRPPDLREHRNLFDPSIVQGTYVVPPPDQRLDVIAQVKDVLADILKTAPD